MPGFLHLTLLAVGLIASTLLVRMHVRSEHTLRLRGIEQHGFKAYYEAKSLLVAGFFQVPDRELTCETTSVTRGRVHSAEQLCGAWPHEVQQQGWHPYSLGITTTREGSAGCAEPATEVDAPVDGPVAPTTCRSVGSGSEVIAGNLHVSNPISSCSIVHGELVVLGYLSLAELDLDCPLIVRAVGTISIQKVTAPDGMASLTVESSNGSVHITSVDREALVYSRTRFPSAFPPPPDSTEHRRLLVGFVRR